MDVCGLEADGRPACKHVVTIYGVITGENDSVGIGMKFLNRGNLKQNILGDDEHRPNEKHVARRLKYIKHESVGLRFLHKNGIVHGDIKADNIMLHSKSGREDDAYAVITDMGLALLKSEPSFGHFPEFGIYPRDHPAHENQDFYALVMTFYCLYHPKAYEYILYLRRNGSSRAYVDKEMRDKIPLLAKDAHILENMIPEFPIRFRLEAFDGLYNK